MPVSFRPPKQPAFPWPFPHARVAPVVLVLLALAASSAVFYFFTSKRLKEKGSEAAPVLAAAASTPPPAAAVPAAGETKEPEAPATEVPKMETAPAPPKPRFGFARPLDLGKDLAQSLARKDFTRASQLAAAGKDESQAEEARAVFESLQALGYQIGSPQQVEVIGQIEQFTRLAIPLQGPEGDAPLRLQIDLERDDQMGWKIARFQLPKVLAEVVADKTDAGTGPMKARDAALDGVAALPASTQASASTGGPVPSASAPMQAAAAAASPLFVVEESVDALTFADGFVKHLLAHQFSEARALLDESRVTGQRLAGLCIVLEEGQFELMAGKPLVMTVVGGDAAWVIAQVKSEKLGQQTEFGIELQRAEGGRHWRVAGLNLSDILGSFAQSAAKIGVPYTPIVKNPKGGESLALYFEYDEAGLHPRARKQLQIVAGLLMSDASRKLRIAGHADALGAEDYNLRLSRQRAESVKRELVALGVPAEQIDTTGLGAAQPIGPNQKSDGSDDPEGRSKNRRAEIYLDF